MHLLKQVLGRRVKLQKPEASEPTDSTWAEYAVDFSIFVNGNSGQESECSYRLEWNVPAAPARSGSFAAEDVADAEDMAYQYFGVKPEEWSVPADAIHTQG